MATEGTRQLKREKFGKKKLNLCAKTTRSGNDYHAGLSRSKFSGDFSLLMVVNRSGMWCWIVVMERGFGSGTGLFGGWRYWGDRVGDVGGFFSRRPMSGAIASWCGKCWGFSSARGSVEKNL